MKRVTGIGGIFSKTKPDCLRQPLNSIVGQQGVLNEWRALPQFAS
jgi:hypothetical protein